MLQWTRLRVPLSRSNRWRRTQLLSYRESACYLSSGVAQSEAPSSGNTEGSKLKKKGRKTTKKVADLPSVYVGASGVAAQPLPEWNPNYIVPPPSPEPDLQQDVPVKPKSRTRRKTDNGTELRVRRGKAGSKKDESQPKENKIVQSANKAPKPVTFLAREILSNLRRFPHCLLLTRVGNFYESYFDQAVEIARLLNIKLTSRKWNGERVAMCGFPIPHLDRYLKILVQTEQRFVAMCEEFPRYDSDGMKEFERRISRIITPGTLIDESFLNPFENNYLLAISVPSAIASQEQIGLAWIDVSTGEFFSKQCTLESIQDELARLAPREIVLDSFLKQSKDHPILLILEETKCLVSYNTDGTMVDDLTIPTSITAIASSTFSPRIMSDEIMPADESPDSTQTKASRSRLSSELLRELDTTPTQEAFAISLLTRFLKEHLLEHMPLLNAPCHENIQDRMQIDAHTIQGLEIREAGLDGSAKGSLLSVVKRTLTTGGTRLLSRWLCSPSTSVAEINRRQTLVAFFHRRQHFRADICEIFKEMDDVGRLCQRFLLGRADFSDLIAINTAINTWAKLKQTCQDEKRLETEEQRLLQHTDEWDALEALFQRMKILDELSDKISQAVILNSDDPNELQLGEDTGPTTDLGEETDRDTQALNPEKLENRWSINPRYSKKLFRVHSVLQELVQQKDGLETDLQRRYGAPSLTLRSTSQLGMFIHLARSKRDKKKIDEDPMFHSIGESLTTKSYFYRDWTVLGNKITEARIALNAAEKDVFDMLRLEVIGNSEGLRRNAHIIDELDVAISFAILAEEMNFVRPEIVEDPSSYSVINGRHPSVEMGLLSSGRQFMPNSIEMGPGSNLHIITGPNMAGKSTFLRQTALIAILAQVGSFVPADFARLGVVDKLFSRIGARDDLFRDRSTFMVEMLETADILRRATDKSLVIMDEVGRGTTVKDGLAIAFAALHHIATVTQSRCLFATHFHELAEMLGNIDNEKGSGVFSIVRFYCSDVDDVGDGQFAYSYKLRSGINRDSHGLKVASLAGVPPTAMAVATETLAWLRSQGTDKIQLDYDYFLKSTIKSTPQIASSRY